jgi:hypothetical protein
MKRLFIIAAVILVIAVGLVGIASAGAGGGGASSGTGLVGDLAEHLLGGGGQGGGSRCRLLGMASGVVADSLGITQSQLQTELQAGKSVEEVAQAHGVNTTDFTALLLQKATAKIAQGVSAGQITQVRGDELAQLLRDSPDIVLNFQLVPGEPLPCISGEFGSDGDEDDQSSPSVTPASGTP